MSRWAILFISLIACCWFNVSLHSPSLSCSYRLNGWLSIDLYNRPWAWSWLHGAVDANVTIWIWFLTYKLFFSLLQVLDVISLFFSLTLILFFLWTIFETVFLPPFFYYYFLIAFYPFYSIAILSAFFSVFLLMTFFGLSLMLTHEKWRKISLPTIYFEGSRMKRESIHLRMPLNKLKVPWEMCENRGWSLSICSML